MCYVLQRVEYEGMAGRCLWCFGDPLLSLKGKVGQLLSLGASALVSSQVNEFGDPAAQL